MRTRVGVSTTGGTYCPECGTLVPLGFGVTHPCLGDESLRVIMRTDLTISLGGFTVTVPRAPREPK
jgi:hypothetical protein